MLGELDGDSSVTYTAKELFDRLEEGLNRRLDQQDIGVTHRFDRQDDALGEIRSELKTMATKDDLSAVREDTAGRLSEVHRRIDGLELAVNDRLLPLEKQSADEVAIQQNRTRFRTNLAWTAGILGSAGVVTAAVLAIVHP